MKTRKGPPLLAVPALLLVVSSTIIFINRERVARRSELNESVTRSIAEAKGTSQEAWRSQELLVVEVPLQAPTLLGVKDDLDGPPTTEEWAASAELDARLAKMNPPLGALTEEQHRALDERQKLPRVLRVRSQIIYERADVIAGGLAPTSEDFVRAEREVNEEFLRTVAEYARTNSVASGR